MIKMYKLVIKFLAEIKHFLLNIRINNKTINNIGTLCALHHTICKLSNIIELI